MGWAKASQPVAWASCCRRAGCVSPRSRSVGPVQSRRVSTPVAALAEIVAGAVRICNPSYVS